MKIQVRVFEGTIPASGTDTMQPGQALVATNVRLSHSELDPLLGPGKLLSSGTVDFTLSISGAKSIYRYRQDIASDTQYWFQAAADTDFVKGPVDGDTEERTYWTDGVNPPRKTKADIATTSPPYPYASLLMGVPSPALGSLDATVVGTAVDPTSASEGIVYVITYVSTWGEESAPSPFFPGSPLQLRSGQTLQVTGFPAAPEGAYSIAGIKLYRAASGTSAAKYQLVNQSGLIALGASSYNDTVLTVNLGAVLPSKGWDVPPTNLAGLTLMANGIMAGFAGSDVCFSEPFIPHAWPIRYRRSVDGPVIACKAFDQSLVVSTARSIYVFSGADPAVMSQDRLGGAPPCVSKRSMVSLDGAVLYAAKNGLYRVGSDGINNATVGLFQPTDWAALKPRSFTAFAIDDRYIAFYDTGAKQAGFVISFAGGVILNDLDFWCSGGFTDMSNDALYLVFGNAIRKWDTGAPATYDWRSGIFRLPALLNMAAARVDADGPVTFTLWADGTQVHSQTVSNARMFKLPGGYQSQRFQIGLSGTYHLRCVEIATTARELSNG